MRSMEERSMEEIKGESGDLEEIDLLRNSSSSTTTTTTTIVIVCVCVIGHAIDF